MLLGFRQGAHVFNPKSLNSESSPDLALDLARGSSQHFIAIAYYTSTHTHTHKMGIYVHIYIYVYIYITYTCMLYMCIYIYTYTYPYVFTLQSLLEPCHWGTAFGFTEAGMGYGLCYDASLGVWCSAYSPA